MPVDRPVEATQRSPFHRPIVDGQPLGTISTNGDADRCPICGMAAMVERRCKIVCRHCRTILQSCADL